MVQQVNKKMIFNNKQIDRYSRQIVLKKIGTAGQKKLLKSSVLIVGAGGLGSPIAIYLAAAGVGKIGIIDKDKVEISNLSRQIIFTMKDIKKNKSSAAISKLKKINKDLKFESFNMKLRYKVGNYSVDIPITARTRASGGWSGKALYITSPGIKLVQ